MILCMELAWSLRRYPASFLSTAALTWALVMILVQEVDSRKVVLLVQGMGVSQQVQLDRARSKLRQLISCGNQVCRRFPAGLGLLLSKLLVQEAV